MRWLRFGWLIAVSATVCVAVYAWQGPLFAAHDDLAYVPSSALECGSLFNIQHYPKHPTIIAEAPWAGANDSGPPQTDVKFRDGCLRDAAVAEEVLAWSGVAAIVLAVLALPVVVSWRRKKAEVAERSLHLSRSDSDDGFDE